MKLQPNNITDKIEKYQENINWVKDEDPPCFKCSEIDKLDISGYRNCSFRHSICEHFKKWKYFKKTKNEKNLVDLKYAIEILDDCWGHHQEGSDLMVNNSELFCRIFNQVIPLIKKSIERINKNP